MLYLCSLLADGFLRDGNEATFDVNKNIDAKPMLNVMKKHPEFFADLPPIPADVALGPGFTFKP